MMQRSEILIVGAGPTGLTLAILLRLRGVEATVIDRRSGATRLPAAHVVNTRSQEVFAEMGVADRVLAAGDPTALYSNVVWAESLAGTEYGALKIPTPFTDPRGPLSPYCAVNIPQTKTESLLLDRLTELGGTVLFGQELVSVDNKEGCISATIRALESEEIGIVDYQWVIGCDGAGSSVRRAVGIDMEGPRTIARFMTIYFSSNQDHLLKDRQSLLYWIGGCEARGVFICFDKPVRTWAMLVPIGEIPLESFSGEAAVSIVKKAIGDEDAQVILTGLSSWNMSAQVAHRYREGRVILAGDACHRFPPTGGLGMNTGIQDAHNLAWKLSAVIAGTATDSLLDTYEAERRPIAKRNSDQSVHNLMKMGMIDEALCLQTLAPISADAGEGPMKRYAPEILGMETGDPNSDSKRRNVQAAIDAQGEHFGQGAGLDLGFVYISDVIIPDGSSPPSSQPSEYRPDAHPGARLPFASASGGYQGSTLSAVAPDGITVFAVGNDWREASRAASTRYGIPVHFVSLGSDAAFGPYALNLLGISERGAVAVRPDGHVLWRERASSSDATNQIELVLRKAFAMEHGEQVPA